MKDDEQEARNSRHEYRGNTRAGDQVHPCGKSGQVGGRGNTRAGDRVILKKEIKSEDGHPWSSLCPFIGGPAVIKQLLAVKSTCCIHECPSFGFLRNEKAPS